MTLRTISDPLDRLSLAEWRTDLCLFIGRSYSTLDSGQQGVVDRIVAETQDYLLKRAAGQPWGEREYASATVSAGTDTTYAFPADLREVGWIREESATRVLLAQLTTKRDYGNAGLDYGASQHPWTTNVRPCWFYDGANSASPSAQQWRRLGADNSGATIRVWYVPYLSLSDPELPASEVAAAREHARYKWAIFSKDWTAAQFLRQAREDEIAATDILDRTTVDAPVSQGIDPAFLRQMG